MPLPFFTFLGFLHPGYSRGIISQNEQGYIMLAFFFKYVVGVGPVSQVFYLNSGFFKYFSAGTIFYGFVKFQMTAWKCPGAVAMGIFAFAQQDSAIVNHNNGNADERSIVHILKNFFHHENTKWGKHEIYMAFFRVFVLSCFRGRFIFSGSSYQDLSTLILLS
jgi:hypothetical protein